MTPAGITPGYVLAGLVVMFAVTMALRAAPFVALAKVRDSPMVRYLGATMPAGVMIILVLYTVQDTTTETASWLPVAAALALTVVVHAVLRRAALSILLGTALYLVLHALFS